MGMSLCVCLCAVYVCVCVCLTGCVCVCVCAVRMGRRMRGASVLARTDTEDGRVGSAVNVLQDQFGCQAA